jgi:hypothetical protein
MKFRRPSAGLIVGVIALIVALSGSAVAASLITSAQIKDGSVRLKDINKNARKALKGQRGPAGAIGTRGLQGAQGSPGAAGANGATKVVVRLGTLISVPNTTTGSVTAECNPGERATGGGNSISGSTGWQVIESFPTPGTAGSTPTGWRVDATNLTGSANNLVALVVCASP